MVAALDVFIAPPITFPCVPARWYPPYSGSFLDMVLFFFSLSLHLTYVHQDSRPPTFFSECFLFYDSGCSAFVAVFMIADPLLGFRLDACDPVRGLDPPPLSGSRNCPWLVISLKVDSHELHGLVSTRSPVDSLLWYHLKILPLLSDPPLLQNF